MRIITRARREADARRNEAYNAAMEHAGNLEERALIVRRLALGLGVWVWLAVLLSPIILLSVDMSREQRVSIMFVESAMAGAACVLLAAACIAMYATARAAERRALALRP